MSLFDLANKVLHIDPRVLRDWSINKPGQGNPFEQALKNAQRAKGEIEQVLGQELPDFLPNEGEVSVPAHFYNQKGERLLSAQLNIPAHQSDPNQWGYEAGETRHVLLVNASKAVVEAMQKSVNNLRLKDHPNNAIMLPPKAVRDVMKQAVIDTMNPSTGRVETGIAPDKYGGFHEEGGFWCRLYSLDINDDRPKWFVLRSQTGAYAKPPAGAAINVFVPSQRQAYIEANLLKTYLNLPQGEKINDYVRPLLGTFHTHPDGVVVIDGGPEEHLNRTNNNNHPLWRNPRPSDGFFYQTPSRTDIDNAKDNGGNMTNYETKETFWNYVLGVKDHTAYIYNFQTAGNNPPFYSFPLFKDVKPSNNHIIGYGLLDI
jgi:hypothetical protein